MTWCHPSGEHNLYGKIFMWEQSLRVPCAIKYPRLIAPGTFVGAGRLVSHADWAPTLLELAGAPPLARAHGRSIRALLAPRGGRDSRDRVRDLHYYRFYSPSFPSSNASVRVPSHLGVRTADGRKLILYDGLRCAENATAAAERSGGAGVGLFEIFDLRADAHESRNLHAEMARSDPGAVRALRRALAIAREQEGHDAREQGDPQGAWLPSNCTRHGFDSPEFDDCVVLASPCYRSLRPQGNGVQRHGLPAPRKHARNAKAIVPGVWLAFHNQTTLARCLAYCSDHPGCILYAHDKAECTLFAGGGDANASNAPRT